MFSTFSSSAFWNESLNVSVSRDGSSCSSTALNIRHDS